MHTIWRSLNFEMADCVLDICEKPGRPRGTWWWPHLHPTHCILLELHNFLKRIYLECGTDTKVQFAWPEVQTNEICPCICWCTSNRLNINSVIHTLLFKIWIERNNENWDLGKVEGMWSTESRISHILCMIGCMYIVCMIPLTRALYIWEAPICTMCFITFLAIYQGKFCFGKIW